VFFGDPDGGGISRRGPVNKNRLPLPAAQPRAPGGDFLNLQGTYFTYCHEDASITGFKGTRSMFVQRRAGLSKASPHLLRTRGIFCAPVRATLSKKNAP
jgi:hypothetical protein